MFDRHVGIYGICFIGDKVLCIKKGKGPYRGMYDSPGGSMEEYETMEETLKREFDEETGLKIAKYEYLTTTDKKFEYEGNTFHHIGIFYFVIAERYDNLKIIPDGHDSEGACFIKSENLNSENCSPLFLEVIKNINKYDKRLIVNEKMNFAFSEAEKYRNYFIKKNHSSKIVTSTGNIFEKFGNFFTEKYNIPEVSVFENSSLIFDIEFLSVYFWSVKKNIFTREVIEKFKNTGGKLNIFGARNYMKDYYFGNYEEFYSMIKSSDEEMFQITLDFFYGDKSTEFITEKYEELYKIIQMGSD